MVALSAISRYLVSNWVAGYREENPYLKFPSAISRYLVPNVRFTTGEKFYATTFPSAISRYLVPNIVNCTISACYSTGGFHPLYRGTWFPTAGPEYQAGPGRLVSIRYIAVLGSQHGDGGIRRRCASSFHQLYRGTWFPTAPERMLTMSTVEFPSAISRYLVSDILGRRREAPFQRGCFHPLYRGTWYLT